ncbi:MAG: 2,3-bisphosphoglycerate-independent phosphoglycerate mutase [Candidatus Krumholzibacteriia bacterium]
MDMDLIRPLVTPNDAKIVLLVMDGLGGLPREDGGPTELEAARTPNLDDLARRGECGLQAPIATGITPGSGPAHLALFGYDPLRYVVGRGVLSALGIDFDLQPDDVAARGNFCTIGPDGKITDRRAGRIPTELGRELCARLREIDLPGAELFVQAEKEYRFVLVLRGENLSGEIADTDPQQVGEEVLTPEPLAEQARGTANIVDRFQRQARQVLEDQDQANGVMLRGFAQLPDWPGFGEVFGVRPAAIATYPMYRGVSRLLGMQVLETGQTFEDEFQVLEDHWNDHDFFYLHIKPTDSAGEDGDFDRKVSVIEQVDALVPRLMGLDPDVVVVTGDHSTPAVMKYHSWHPVPVLIWSRFARPDGVTNFGERPCLGGSLGVHLPAAHLMPLALAHARKLDKFGA